MAFGAIDSAKSGLSFATQRFGVAAYNIANANSRSFMPVSVEGAAVSGGGVVGTFSRSGVEGVDLAEQIVSMRGASTLYRSNIAVLRTAEENLGSVIDFFV